LTIALSAAITVMAPSYVVLRSEGLSNFCLIGRSRQFGSSLLSPPEKPIVSSDRGGGYREAAANALPHAVQVADRGHLMENASAAFRDVVRKSMLAIPTVIGAKTNKSWTTHLR
jgi:hypothetical protein